MPEKIQTLLIILLGIVIFVVRIVRKARETMRREAQERGLPQPGENRPPTRTVRPPSAPSFEDLLQQMMEQNRREQASAPAPTPSRETTQPARSLETVQRPARSLEETALDRPARSLEAPAVKKPKKAAALPRAVAVAGKENYWTREAAASRAGSAPSLAERLRSPEDVRAAFLLGEILQRKY